MLDSAELEFLRTGLTDKATKPGALIGMTYSEIADVLNVDRDAADKVTADSVRYYVRQLRKVLGSAIARPAKRGWPLGRVRRLDQRRAVKKLPGLLFRELLALTGETSSALYESLKQIPALISWLPPKRTFYAQLARTGRYPERPRAARSLSQTVVEQCRVRLHQITFKSDDSQDYWVIIAGFEQTTQYLNLVTFDVRVDSENVRRRGRPKEFDPDLEKVAIYRNKDETRIELPSAIWEMFIASSINRLGLPVTQFALASDPGTVPSNFLHRRFHCTVTKGLASLTHSPVIEIDDEDLASLRRSLPVAANQHNQRRYDELRFCRSDLKELFVAARAAGRPDFKTIPLSQEIRQRIQILDYFHGMDAPIQLQLRDQNYRPIILRGEVRGESHQA